MPQLPENIRPVVALLAKHHFWLLAMLVPLVVVPLLLVARGGLQADIKSRQGAIRGKIDSLSQVRNRQPHPNEGWRTEIDAEANRIRRETLSEWQKFWDSQAFLRVWPKELGDDFLAAVRGPAPLAGPLVQRYQNTIPDVVRTLPARMGAADAMEGEESQAVDAAAERTGQAAAGRRARQQPLVLWNADDQRRLLDAFAWQTLPRDPRARTTQVLLAQEELWVYGLFCDAIARANKGAAGPYNAAIVNVERLAVGYPSLDERPGGVGGNRVYLPKTAAQPEPEFVPAGMPAGAEGGPLTKPQHPRFGGGSSQPTPPADAAAAAGTPGDAALRGWIYVDFDGKPLSAEELATSPAARMTHLVPFVLRLRIDQRRLDAFLVDLATDRIPIDVREVRINPGGRGDAAADGGQAAEARQAREHDVLVELRGTVGLATPPSAGAVGLEPPPAPAAAQGMPASRRRAAHPLHGTERGAA